MSNEREFLRSLTEGRHFRLKPIQVLEGKPSWEVGHEFSDDEILMMLREQISDDQRQRMRFAEVYKMRWLENAVQDSQGEYWLKNSKAVRIPLLEYARMKKLKIVLSLSDLL